MAKKRKCRYTAEELAIHEEAVRLRKMTDGEVIWKTERDGVKATRHLIVEALQYPNLKDPDLMKYYGCVDITEMPLKVFSRADEYQHVNRIVMQALGLAAAPSDEEELEDAKNS